MARVTWTQDALADLKEVTAYIALDSPRVAPVFARRLRDSGRRLRDFPLSGRIAPDLESETVREVLFHDYRILYEVIEGHVWVLGVTHGSRDLRRLAKRRRWS